MRAAVSEEFEIPLSAIVFVYPATFPRTSSGKVARRICCDEYRTGRLEVVYEWLETTETNVATMPAGQNAEATPEAPSLPSQANGNAQPASHALELRRVLESWLQKQIQEVVELEEPPPPDLSFFRMGVDSLRAVELANRLSRFLGSEEAAPTTLAFDYPTIGGLVQHIMDRLNRSTGNESTQVKPAEGTQKEPVAIIGLSCRFPGAADQCVFLAPTGVWVRITAISEVPGDRWDVDAYYNPSSDVPGTITSRWGGFLKDIDQFDAAFFGISPREAQELDPQQRMLLEQTWCALEDGGIDPHRLAGSRTGVFVGISTSDYAHLLLRQGDEAIGPDLESVTHIRRRRDESVMYWD